MHKLVKGAIKAGKAARRIHKADDKKAAIQQEAGTVGEGVGQALGGMIPIPGAAKLGKNLGRKAGERIARTATDPNVQQNVRNRLAEFHGATGGGPVNPFSVSEPSSGEFIPTPSEPGGPKNPFA
jgi:hypothetical protein